MISIIIASVQESFLKNVTLNIQQTIGVEFEVISYDNSKGELGLCEIYNLGAKQAKYDLLCFMHEDVDIKSQNWGLIVAEIFKNKQTGLVGLAGSTYKSIAPSGWFCNGGPQKINYINLLQRYKFDEADTFHHLQNPKGENLSEVIAVDGVWFCTRKAAVLKYPFDALTFKKFHCYDIDFSLSIRAEYKTYVTFEVLLAHFSEGNYDRTWVEETLKLYDKWNKILPIDIEGLSKKDIKVSEKHAFRFFLNRMKIAKFNKKQRLNVVLKSKIYQKVGLTLFLKLCIEA
ncbi:glycosyltransferase [Pedobacter mucosus]|uniref:glycosyltransferase n=1 Tax=Pedobacter mucosus TaxID=2895286 RepID=UPI001EE49C27|nr:glycosyltransferase [Pedobacter mucosus]UKT63814.1 glycosyltransferase family protein [Pedobacter mucosus]